MGLNLPPEILPLKSRPTAFNGSRISLLIPSCNSKYVFGGISTAIDIFLKFEKFYDYMRVVNTDTKEVVECVNSLSDFKVINDDLSSHVYKKSIVSVGDRRMSLPIGENDVFICTSWWSAYIMKDVIDWQQRAFSKPRKFILYLIQDYECLFYPWGSKYVLCKSTYIDPDSCIALFNSSLLKKYFENNGFSYKHSFYFEPVLNASLKTHLHQKDEAYQKKKSIFLYGRPSVDRNLFAVAVAALKIWSNNYADANSWEINSCGEYHEDIVLGKNIIKSKGKLTLNKYAEILSNSSVAVSFMISPHPSYPPLEAATFGCKVLTNTYANKNLSNYHNNITSIVDLRPENIAENISNLCSVYTEELNPDTIVNLGFMEEYLKNDQRGFSFFNKIVEILNGKS